MIRIPDEGRFEFRAADGAVNPYLLQSGIIAMGLDGMQNKRSPGKRLDINMYTQGHKLKRIKKRKKTYFRTLQISWVYRQWVINSLAVL